jgi:hypothetical protein
MTATRRRSARRTHAGGGQPQLAQKSTNVPSPLPEWRWRTFPVYFAFALGAFIFTYVGVVVGATSDSNGPAVFVLFITVALLMGFGMSRITTRWLLTRRFARNRNREP